MTPDTAGTVSVRVVADDGFQGEQNADFDIVVAAAAVPVLSVSINNTDIAEAAGTSRLTVSTGSDTFGTEQTITLTLCGTATQMSDYTITSTSLTLAAKVTATQDTVDDDNETVTIMASHNGNTISAVHTISITDDDAPPTLSVSVNNDAIAEAGGTSTLSVSTGGSVRNYMYDPIKKSVDLLVHHPSPPTA